MSKCDERQIEEQLTALLRRGYRVHMPPQDGEVTLGVHPVVPLLAQDAAETFADLVTLRRRVSGFCHRLGHLGEPLVGELGEDGTDRRHPIGPQGEHLVE